MTRDRTKRRRTEDRSPSERPSEDARRAQRSARRAELLDAAIDVIRQRGPGASMEQMAAGAGVTKPIIYRQFGDRDGLIGAVAERFAAAVATEVAVALEGSADPKELLRATIDAYLSLVERDQEVYRFVVQRAARNEGAGAPIGGLMPEIAQRVAVVIGERLREAGGDSGAAEPWAFGIVGMVYLAGDWWLARRTMPREALVDYLVALVWDGLGTAAPPPG